MASYHFRIKSGKKGSASNHAKYIGRKGKYSKEEADNDLAIAGHGNMPLWASNDPELFWKMADKYERANGAAYREIELALPAELTLEQQQSLLEQFINTMIGAKPHQFAIHVPNAALGDVRQPHGHLMYSDRADDGIIRPPELHFKRYNASRPEAGGAKKDSGGKTPQILRESLTKMREAWADIQNKQLEVNGHSARVDHRSYRDRGIKKTPERHLGHRVIKGMSDEERQGYLDTRKK